jgi:hypothetical protein
MRSLLILLSGGFTIAATVPYVREIVQRKTKPRIVSWFTWSAILCIGAYASFAQHQIPAAVYTLFCAFECFAVVLLGLRYGDRQLEKMDLLSLAGGLIGLAMLIIYKSPVLAVLVSIGTDFIGAIPTIRHSWESPDEETWSAFLLYGIGSGITLLLANFHVITAIAYPIYLLILDGALTCIVIWSPHHTSEDTNVEVVAVIPEHAE